MKNYLAFDAVNFEHCMCETQKEAEKQLIDLVTEFAEDGLDESHHNESFVAEIKGRIKFKEVDSKDNYPCKHGKEYCNGSDSDCPEECDDNPYPYNSDFDYVSEVVINSGTIEAELNRIKDLCKEEIKAGSFFNGNIQACEFAYWLQHSGYEPEGLPIGKFSSIDALSMMQRWAEEN